MIQPQGTRRKEYMCLRRFLLPLSILLRKLFSVCKMNFRETAVYQRLILNYLYQHKLTEVPTRLKQQF